MESSSAKGSKRKISAEVCKVCGDQTFGKNFGVYSCESCKAFFRRNCDKATLFGRCDGQCEITKATRTICKKCRLQKCFNMGMTKDNTDEAVADCSSCPVGSSGEKNATMTVTPGVVEPEDTTDPAFFTEYKPGEFLFPIELIPEPLKNIQRAWSASFDIPIENLPKKPSTVDFVNLIEVPTRCLIKFAKELQCFKSLPSSDQITLLKGSIMEVMMIHASITYNPLQNHWKVKSMDNTDTEVSPESLLKNSSEEVKKCFQMGVEFARSLRILVKGDFLLIKSLVALSLFTSDRGSLNDKDQVQEEQEMYAEAVHQYIKLNYSNHKALFAKLMNHLVTIRDIEDIHNQMLMQMDVTELRPLIVELFDLSI